MKRSIGVTLSAVVVLLGCLVVILCGVLTVAAPFMAPGAGPAPPRGVTFIGAGFLFALAVWGILSAIGLFRLRPWARISILVFSGFLVVGMAFSMVAILLMPIPMPNNVPQMTLGMRLGISAVYLVPMLIGAWWLYLFNKRSVKDQFRGIGLAAGAPARPLSISIIAWLLLAGAAMMAVMSPFRMPAVFFGLVLTGWKSSLVFLCYAAIQAYLGFGLLKLRPLSRTLAIYYLILGAVNGLSMAALPGRDARFAAALGLLPPEMRVSAIATTTASLWFGAIGGGLTIAAGLCFLITRRSAFSAG